MRFLDILPSWSPMAFLVALGLFSLLYSFLGAKLGNPIYRLAPFMFIYSVIFVFNLSEWTNSTDKMREDNLQDAGRRMVVIFAALDKYHEATQRYPGTLGALIPEYLDAIPQTGMMAYPEFEYRAAAKGDPFNSYEIFVRTKSPMLAEERFVFWPEGNYPAELYGGYTEPVGLGAWAYVHNRKPKDWPWFTD